MKTTEQSKNQCKHILLSSIANARNLKYTCEDSVSILETSEIVTDDSNKIAKDLLGQTATIKDLESAETILNYIKKLPNYEELIAEARQALIEEGIEIPETKYIEIFQPGSLGWMRQLIDICK